MNLRLRKLLTPAILLVVLCAASAFAKNGKHVTFNKDIAINGTTLAAGSYGVTWSAESGDPTINFVKGKQTVATVQAKWVDRGAKYDSDSVVYTDGGNGSRSIAEIRFAGMSQVLVFGDAS